MDAEAAIAGITMSRYAELVIAVEGVADLATQLQIIQALGVTREAWAEATRGWGERLRDPSMAAPWAEARRMALDKRQAAAMGDRYLPPPRASQGDGAERHVTGPMPAQHHATAGYPPPPPMSGAPVLGDASGFATGASLWVMWADGQRYRGQALASVPGQTHVRLETGEMRWVENRWLSPR